MKRVRFQCAVGGSEQNGSIDILGYSACKKIGDAGSVTPKPTCDPSRTAGIQVPATGLALSQQASMDTSEDAGTISLLADTKQQTQATTPEMLPDQGLPVYISLLPDTTVRTTELLEVLIPEVSPTEYLALSRLGGNISLLSYYYLR